ncbi:MAG: hypothetical protein R3Y04_02710 [Rikenellaceae bacterium]
MKSIFKSLMFLCFIALSYTAQAQNFDEPQFAPYGRDAAEREKNFTLYTFFNDAYAAKNYDEASFYLKQLLENVPAVHANLYIKGSTVFKRLALREKDLEKRAIYVDSLMIVHEHRIQHFGEDPKLGRPYIMNQMIKDNITFRANKPDLVIETVNHIISEIGSEMDIEILPVYYNYLNQLYRDDVIETDVMLAEYETVLSTINASTAENKDELASTVENLLMASGAASCENLEIIFKPQYEANPDDKELIAKIAQTLSRAACSSDFQLVVAEKYYVLEPSAAAAASLAFTFDKKGEVEKALQYYDEAIEKETDNSNKTTYALSAAGVTLVNKDYSKAIQYTRKAISINPESGLAYLLLAQAQAATVPDCGAFEKKTAFWLIVDNLVKARGLLEGDQAANASKLITSYSANFPSKEDVFFRDLSVGDKFTVSCGSLSGTTTVRTSN